jgi:hypothetical protein
MVFLTAGSVKGMVEERLDHKELQETDEGRGTWSTVPRVFQLSFVSQHEIKKKKISARKTQIVFGLICFSRFPSFFSDSNFQCIQLYNGF